MDTTVKSIPHDVTLKSLAMNHDNRGWLTEIYRKNWDTAYQPIQWDAVHSNANVMRGAHLHLTRSDFILLMGGKMVIGMRDVRENSPTKDLVCIVELIAEQQQLLIIPPGIVHGFWHPEQSIILYGMDYYWDPNDELNCQWNDPELGIPWPCTHPILSPRDTDAGSFKQLMTTSKMVAA